VKVQVPFSWGGSAKPTRRQLAGWGCDLTAGFRYIREQPEDEIPFVISLARSITFGTGLVEDKGELQRAACRLVDIAVGRPRRWLVTKLKNKKKSTGMHAALDM
jgi:hypothetical protein